MISKIRVGNYGVGNTYMKVKKCLLCEGKNNESHLIMKCPELAVARTSTNITEFIEKNRHLDDSHGHKLLRTFLDPSKDVRATLQSRIQDVVYILKTWDIKVKKLKDEDETFCYCKQSNDSQKPMVQCDKCSNWFHFSCTGLDSDFASLDEWYCKHCIVVVADCTRLCTCGDEFDPNKQTIMCRGTCKTLYHPECVGVDLGSLSEEYANNWKCTNCSNYD